MADFYTLLTNAGIAYETACKAAGTPIKLTTMSVGDGGGSVYSPDAAATALKREVWRGPLNALFQDPANPSWLLAEVTIPPDVGGWYVREAGLWTDTGVLYAIVKYPESFKPVLATSGSGKEFYIRSIFETSNAALVTLLIDDSIVKATRAWVTSYVADELAKLDAKQSVRVATTTNITLNSPQTIDGVAVVPGDRVLVKNQTSAKDNGLWVVAAAGWVRAKDADISEEVTSGLTVSVEQGGTQADTIWQLVTDGVVVLGTTPLAFQNVTQGFAPLNSPAFKGAATAESAPRFDSSKLLATTEWTRNSLGSFSGASAPSSETTLTAAYVGRLITFGGAGAYTVTMPAASSLVDGASMLIQNVASSEITLSRQGTDILVLGSNSSTSLSLGVGEYLVATVSGVNWVFTGSSSLKNTAGFSALLGTSGYQKLPSGQIEQWGLATIPGSATSIEVTLPIAFPNAILHGISSDSGGTCYPSGIQITAGVLSKVVIYVAPYNASSGSIAAKSAPAAINWRVVGR